MNEELKNDMWAGHPGRKCTNKTGNCYFRKTDEGGTTGFCECYKIVEKTPIPELLNEKELGLAELKGAAKILDMLWKDSFYRCGHDTSKLIEEEMIRLFSKNWSSVMYKLIDSKQHIVEHVKPLKEL